MKEKFLTTTEAAKKCHVSRFTMRNWLNREILRSIKTAGGHRRVLFEDLNRFILEHQALSSSGNGSGDEKQVNGGNGCEHDLLPPMEFEKLNGASGASCARWVLFRERENECLLVVKKNDGAEKCRANCEICASMNQMQTLAQSGHARNQPKPAQGRTVPRSEEASMGSEILRLGFFNTGKYAASIANMFSRPNIAQAGGARDREGQNGERQPCSEPKAEVAKSWIPTSVKKVFAFAPSKTKTGPGRGLIGKTFYQSGKYMGNVKRILPGNSQSKQERFLPPPSSRGAPQRRRNKKT